MNENAPVWLWLAILLSGLYHGINPGMGWPLAVATGLMEKNPRALFAALWPLSLGHLSAMLVMLLPFALLIALAQWQHQLQAAAGFVLVTFGIFRLLDPRHPRVLARNGPTQLALWSFVVAIAHGAGLMLVPIYLGLCQVSGLDRGHEAAAVLVDANLGMAVIVSAAAVPHPTQVRYAWQSNPAASLFNGAGLPAGPFRTDISTESPLPTFP